MDPGGGEEVRAEGERGGGVSIWDEVGIHEQALGRTVKETTCTCTDLSLY